MEVRPEPIREPRRVPVQLLAAIVILVVAAVAVAASLMRPGVLDASPGGGLAAAAAAATPFPDASGHPGRGVWPGMGGMNGAGPSWMGGMGGGRANGDVARDITISAINGTTVSLSAANGWSRTVNTTGVTITRAGSTITVGDLKVGDHVAIQEKKNSDGTYTVTKLTVVLDTVSGKVTKLDASSITVSTFGNTTVTITTTSSTVYRQAGQTIARSAIAVGQRLMATGKKGSDGSLAAEAVDVQADVVFGTVTKVSGSTITVATIGGGTATVQVTSATTFQVAGKTSATLADVAAKDTIVAQGVLGSGGTLTATSVRTGRFGFPTVPNGHGWGPGGAKPSASAGTSG